MSLKKSFFCLGLALVMLSPFSSTANGNLVGEEQQKKDPQKIEKFLLDYASSLNRCFTVRATGLPFEGKYI
ncbi:hypothetical protein P4H70_06595 [Paenibacillus ehimensis]|uniref:hypothetical protein n=1 Tax=Paenibacillus ehimensis TaxID=79264 RepID=UPI002DB6160D|nr:hypothetical protein [Paenibacillus ehimensis]MEC0208616.1 hypothetical protein [Paenibacillus ehimensis]